MKQSNKDDMKYIVLGKAKVLGGFFSSKGLLTGNVVELVPMEIPKKCKNYCMFIEGWIY